MPRYVIFPLVFLLFSFLYASPASAQAGGQEFTVNDQYPSDNDVNSIAKDLYCPVCPNTPLDVCETKACADWRAQIKDQLADGWSREMVVDYFVAQYGERVLAEPQRKGFTSLVWVLPVLGTLLGSLLIMQVLKSWRTSRGMQAALKGDSQEIPPEILMSLEKELQEMD